MGAGCVLCDEFYVEVLVAACTLEYFQFHPQSVGPMSGHFGAETKTE